MPQHDFNNHPRLAAAIAAFQAGDPVLLLDDADRENEADIVAAADNLKTETMVRMIRNGSGIVCLCLDQASADALETHRVALTITIVHK